MSVVSSRGAGVGPVGREPTRPLRPSRSEARSIEIRVDYDPMIHVLRQPELVPAVIPSHELERMACAGGLRVYLEQRLGPGRYVAAWIGPDGCAFDEEKFDIPDLLKLRERAWREKNERKRLAEREQEYRQTHEWIEDHASMALTACLRADPSVNGARVLAIARSALAAHARRLRPKPSHAVQVFLCDVLGRSPVWSGRRWV